MLLGNQVLTPEFPYACSCNIGKPMFHLQYFTSSTTVQSIPVRVRYGFVSENSVLHAKWLHGFYRKYENMGIINGNNHLCDVFASKYNMIIIILPTRINGSRTQATFPPNEERY